MNQAINTLVVLSEGLTGTGSGQAEYFTEFEELGLEQKPGETNEELYERAAGICRSHGLSAEEVAGNILGVRDSRLPAGYHLGDISPKGKVDVISGLSSKIAKVYDSSTESE